MANKILSIMLIAVAAVACSKNPVESPVNNDGRMPFLEYVTDKVPYLAEEAFSLKSGMCYNYVMTISNSPQSIVINIGGSIEDWN